jgi:hypothetical protein
MALGGLFAVGAVIADVVNTLISTRLGSGRWWPTEVLYRVSWPVWRSLGRRIADEDRREVFLSMYAPLSLLTLLVMWVVGLVLGWTLVWWGLSDEFAPHIDGFTEALYYSGVAFFSLGFGEILAAEENTRLLTVAEAFTGLGTIALVIGYLPALYGAYSTRETQLLMLDDLTGDQIQPFALIEAHSSGGDLDRLEDFFGEWERWTAQVLESHVSYHMLTLFRSQHRGQSWVTALGVVADAAAGAHAIEGMARGRATFLYRRASRTINVLADRLSLKPKEGVTITRSMFRIGYGRLASTGLRLRPFDDAWSEVDRLRSTYVPQLEALIDYLDAPRGFWGHTFDRPIRAAQGEPAERQ